MLENAQSIKVLLWWRKKLFSEEAFSVVRQKPTNCSQLRALLKRELAQKLMSNLPQRTAELIRRRTSKYCLHKSDLFANKSC